MREFPIKKFWYGKGAAYRDIEELMEKNSKWFIWAVGSFQDLTPSQAEHFYEVYGMRLPNELICSQELLNEFHEQYLEVLSSSLFDLAQIIKIKKDVENILNNLDLKFTPEEQLYFEMTKNE